MSYTKLHASIINSTVWRLPNHIRIVWITMLAMADQDGMVRSSVPGLADASRVTLNELKDALECFMSPDEYSATPDDEGRRIEPAAGGWRILNYDLYRERLSESERRMNAAQRQQRYRAKTQRKSVAGDVTVTPVTHRPVSVTPVTHCPVTVTPVTPKVTLAEAEAEAEAEVSVSRDPDDFENPAEPEPDSLTPKSNPKTKLKEIASLREHMKRFKQHMTGIERCKEPDLVITSNALSEVEGVPIQHVTDFLRVEALRKRPRGASAMENCTYGFIVKILKDHFSPPESAS